MGASTSATQSPSPLPSAATGDAAGGEGKPAPPKCKACCACPETKQVRDACIVERGQENCEELIEAHRKCMLDMGFKI